MLRLTLFSHPFGNTASLLSSPASIVKLATDSENSAVADDLEKNQKNDD